MNKTNRKIAEQSRERLTDALLAVMEQYDFREITVTQITQEAGLSRKTFYRLFSAKEDILSGFLEKKTDEFIERVKAQEVHHYWELVQLYFDYWEENRQLLELLKRHKLLLQMTEISYRRSLEVFELVRSQEVMLSFMPLLPYLLAYGIGGMHSMLINWIENDMEIPSSVLIESLKTGLQSPEI